MKSILKTILYLLAWLTIRRYKPRVVAITGSVGKTSTKDAITIVLRTSFSVRASLGNYNNELGVPLAIINEESGGQNPLIWLFIFIKAFFKLFIADYPKILILELGSDRPGDIAYLVKLIGKIDVAVLTDIGISHLEFFAGPTELAKEKLSLIKKLDRTALAILNFDNPKVFEGRTQTKAEIAGYGFSQNSQVMISDFQIIQVDGVWGVNFKLHHKGTVVPFFIPNTLGKPTAYAATAAVVTALRFNINLVESSEALKRFVPPAGRLRMIPGIKQALIIDDTYNAAPDSTIAGLEALSLIASGRRVIALGGMAELGKQTESGHRAVAGKIVENKIDLVFLVGENAKIIRDELSVRKFGGRVQWFETADLAGLSIQESLLPQDTILVKGSQSSRMEKIVKEIMADPLRASELLVRQSDKWLAKI